MLAAQRVLGAEELCQRSRPGFLRVIVPRRQTGEAKLVAGIDVFGMASITQMVAFLQGGPMPLVDPIDVIGDRAGKHTRTAV